MTADFKIAVLLSGRGSNLESLMKQAKHYRITHVFSNKEDTPGLKKALSAGIQARAIAREPGQSLKDHKRLIFEAVKSCAADLIVLAGFMQILEAYFIEYFHGRLVNIHPSLLPKFPGLDTHRRAIEAGETQHGCSVHFVDKGVDTGPLIAQAALSLMPNENEAALAARVLELEHRLYPFIVNGLASAQIEFSETGVSWQPAYRKQAEHQGFLIPE